MNEELKHHWIKICVVVLLTFLVSYLAFYLAMKHNLKRLNNPFYQSERLEKLIQKQEADFEKYTLRKMENPFEPRMRPMLVNLVKEIGEYKIIVDLNPLNGNEEAINVNIDNGELTISGQMDKKFRGSEKIISFTQTYYLDEKIDKEKITREKKGEKYIITLPFGD